MPLLRDLAPALALAPDADFGSCSCCVFCTTPVLALAPALAVAPALSPALASVLAPTLAALAPALALALALVLLLLLNSPSANLL